MATLAWTETVAEVPERGLVREREATAEERAALAAAIGALSCERLCVRYEVTPRAGGRYVLAGTLLAELTRECVVSLDPVPERIEARLSVDFEPQSRSDDDEAGGTVDPFSETEIEPIENGHLAVGRVVEEEIASRLDPYPRHPDARLEQTEAGGDRRDNPFAGLAALKRKMDGGA